MSNSLILKNDRIKVNDIIENVKFSIVLRRKTNTCVLGGGGGWLWCGGVGGVKRNKTQTIITGYHLNPNQKQ